MAKSDSDSEDRVERWRKNKYYSDSEDPVDRKAWRKTVRKMRKRLPGLGRSSSMDTAAPNSTTIRRDYSGGKQIPNDGNTRQRSNTYPSGFNNLPGYNWRFDSSDPGHRGCEFGDSEGSIDDISYLEFCVTPRGSSSTVNYDVNRTDSIMGTTSSLIPFRSFIHHSTQSDSDQEDTKKVRVKPYNAFSGARFMNETDLYRCMMAGSTKFESLTSYLNPSTEATRHILIPEIVQRQFGSPKEDGRVGSLRLEVLGCVGLNRVKPEVSVYVVCGDCAFTTDIIEGYRSPMWPNASKRAAILPLHHAYARVFIGVFDVQQRKEKEADHLCGRGTIDIASLRPDTEYDITFPLRASSFVYDRRPRGVVRVRFSLHWFSERSALLSYLKRPRNPLAFSRQAKKFPTIPCGDPNTFRNVAVTVHGKDFPGKYTHKAFRSTIREFNLSHQNILFLVKALTLDCIFYENPLLSIYVFLTSMYCVYLNSVGLAPPFIVGGLIYLLVENNVYYSSTQEGHLGYQGITLQELFFALLFDGKNEKRKMNPILVKKRPRRQVIREDGEYIDIELHNHREFPFSERFEYPKFSAADAIAPSQTSSKKSAKNTDNRAVRSETARRLSIHTLSSTRSLEVKNEESDDESEETHDEGDGILDETEYGYANTESSDDDDDSVERSLLKNDDNVKQSLLKNDDTVERSPLKNDDNVKRSLLKNDDNVERSRGRLLEAGQSSKYRRIRVGPEQNNDKTEDKRNRPPPQSHLMKVEGILHKASKNISVEHVYFPPPQLQTQLGKEVNAKGPAGDLLTKNERKYFDEFDKLLGYRLKNPNPILKVTSSFLGPLMRIIRIAIYLFRISFNVCTWRDPYLTFWILSLLFSLMFVLFIFPWRFFFFLSTLILLGPQNIATRKYLEHRANRREQEKEGKRNEASKDKLKINDPLRLAPSQLQQPKIITASENKKNEEKGGKKKRRWGLRQKKEEIDQQEDEIKETEIFHSPRPVFYAHFKPNKKTRLVPRDVAIPYFRFRKDRFYDWPPDPTVSRATPMVMTTRFDEEEGNRPREMYNKPPGGRLYQGKDEWSGLRKRSNKP